jgi:hypothetical protein
MSNRPFLDADGINVIAALLEQNARQRPGWRPGAHAAGFQVEQSFMAGAMNLAALGARNDRARKVRALLRISD